ncbi:zinc finger, CCHC-type containing protein [Tanacetum coccineum]
MLEHSLMSSTSANRYAKHSKAFGFYVIKPNDSVAINSIIESTDAILDENRFSSVPRPSQRSLVKGTEDSSGLVVLEKVTDEDDPKTFDEAMKSQDVAFGKESINDEMDSIMDNNTWVLTDLPPGCRPLGCKWIFKRKLKVDGTIEKFKTRLVIQGFKQKLGIDYFNTHSPVDLTNEFLSSRFSMKDMGEADYPIDTSEKLMPNNGQDISQLEYYRVIGGLLNVCHDYTRPDIAFAMGKLSRLMYTGYPSMLEGYTDASWINNTEDNSSTSGWVFLLGGGAISWASKKQTCITGSTIESEFVALVKKLHG